MSGGCALRFAAWTLGLFAAATLGTAAAQESASEPGRADAARLMNELMTGKGPIGGPFSLPDQRGRRVGPAQWRGKVVLMYFGYTFCPDVCPTELSNIAAAIDALGPQGARVQPVFVTLDPLRDKPALVGTYAQSFNPRFAALGGTEAEVREVALSYKVFYEKVRRPGSDHYLIDTRRSSTCLTAKDATLDIFRPARVADGCPSR